MANRKQSAKNVGGKIIPYGTQSIDASDVVAVSRTLKSGWLTQGPAVLLFEQLLQKFTGARHTIAVSNGTVALHIAYITAGMTKGDEVIIPANTFAATANMVLALGGTPVFCDIRTDTYNIDEKKIERLITNKTKAIVPVHYAGAPCEMDTIHKIAQKHNLIVIEDACHALGAEYKGVKVGNLKSDMAVFSFHPVKILTTGEGGAVLTNNAEYARRLKRLRSHGIERTPDGFNHMIELGFNYRLTDIQSSLGASQMKRIKLFLKRRRSVATSYAKLFKNKKIMLPSVAPGTLSAWHLYPIVLPKSVASKRGEIMRKLRERGIGTQVHYPPVYLHPYYKKIGYKEGLCPVAEDFGRRELSIPMFADLTHAEQKKVVCELETIIQEL